MRVRYLYHVPSVDELAAFADVELATFELIDPMVEDVINWGFFFKRMNCQREDRGPAYQTRR